MEHLDRVAPLTSGAERGKEGEEIAILASSQNRWDFLK